MALLNLKLVSESLKNLLEKYFEVYGEWDPMQVTPTVSTLPPDKLSGDAVGIYLYHISEDSQYKNLPAPGNDRPPIRYVPMGLNLHYLLTAKSNDLSSDTDMYNEQHMMGIAMKVFHDYPVISDSTKINGSSVFPVGLQGTDNRFRITLQPTAPAEAINYWTAGNSPQRLAAYYEVSVVLLEPEEIQSRSARILDYGVQIFTSGPPRLIGSRNTLSFTIPGQTKPRTAELRPAQAPPTTLTTNIPLDHRIKFNGVGLGGDQVKLLLKNERWDEPQELDSPWWKVSVDKDGISAVVRKTTHETGDSEDLLPGIYSALVKVSKENNLPDRSVRNIDHLSNECPFTVSPWIEAITDVDIDKKVVISGYLFKYEINFENEQSVQETIDLLKNKLSVFLGNNRLKQVELTNPEPNTPGVFWLISDDTLKLCLPEENTEIISGKYYPLRIIVNGAESPPKWIKYP